MTRCWAEVLNPAAGLSRGVDVHCGSQVRPGGGGCAKQVWGVPGECGCARCGRVCRVWAGVPRMGAGVPGVCRCAQARAGVRGCGAGVGTRVHGRGCARVCAGVRVYGRGCARAWGERGGARVWAWMCAGVGRTWVCACTGVGVRGRGENVGVRGLGCRCAWVCACAGVGVSVHGRGCARAGVCGAGGTQRSGGEGVELIITIRVDWTHTP